MCCLEFLAKYILFFFNLVFVLLGVGLITVGTLLKLQLNDLTDALPVSFDFIPVSVIVLGCIVFLIAFFGCCGAIRESRCLLILYSVCMIILAGIKIYITVLIFRSLDSLHSAIGDWLVTLFERQPLGGPFQVVETVFTCCGTSGAGAYTMQNLTVPPTCCSDPVDLTCAGDTFVSCVTRVDNYFTTFSSSIGYVFIVVIVIELVAMILALIINHSAMRQKQRKQYY